MSNEERNSLNACIFKGRLTEYVTNKVGDNQYLLGKGFLLIPSEEHEASKAGQRIRLVAWGDIAERLAGLPTESWIKVLCTYSPEYYGSKLYDNFVVGSFSVL